MSVAAIYQFLFQLSSPVRDPLQTLSKLELEEVSVNFDLCSDQSLEVKCSLQSLSLEDTRSDSTLVHTRIFHSSCGESDSTTARINVSSPNMVDVTYRQTSSGDASSELLFLFPSAAFLQFISLSLIQR